MEHNYEDVYISPDFQSDQTEGYPASLCWDMCQGVAWLELNTSLAGENEDISHYEQLCKDFGEQSCGDWEDFNSILKELGEDAVHSAYVHDEPEEFGGLSL